MACAVSLRMMQTVINRKEYCHKTESVHFQHEEGRSKETLLMHWTVLTMLQKGSYPLYRNYQEAEKIGLFERRPLEFTSNFIIFAAVCYRERGGGGRGREAERGGGHHI